MSDRRFYGDAVAHSLRLKAPPAFVTRSLQSAQIGISRLSIGTEQLGMTPRIRPEDTFILALYLTPVPYHELWSGGRAVIAQGYGANAMRIVNLVDGFSANITCPHETMVFYIPRAALDSLTEKAGGRSIATLTCPPGIIDPVVVQLGAMLLPAFRRPHEASTLFVDHVTLAICAHLVHIYGGLNPPDMWPKGGLTPAKARRAMDFLAGSCRDDVGLADVARECGLSRGYFARAFRVTTGLTPHQWLQQHRVELAEGLLSESATPIVDVAAICGFSDQSHLTRVFSRLVGVSPAAWRRRFRE